MRLRDLTNYLDSVSSSGATFDELKNRFEETDPEDLKRICHAAIDLDEVKTDGKGRGLRYYGINYEIVKITNGDTVRRIDTNKFIDGKIDVSDCLNTKEKIQKILASEHPLSGPILLSYRENISDISTNRELKDFIKNGVKDCDVRLYYDPKKKQNIVYSKNERVRHNSLWLGIVDNKYIVRKHFNDSQDQPEVREFDKYEEFEKLVRTLLPK